MRDQQPVGQKGQDVPWTGEVERGSVAAPCPLGSHSPSSPVLGVPFPILTPCLMPCPRPDAVLTSLTCTRAYTVCSSPCLCLGTGVPWVYIQTGRSLPSQGNGSGRVRHWSTHQWPPHLLGPAHPHPCPPPQCQLPGLTECLGPAKDRTWGCIPGLDSATPTHSRPDLASTQCQSPSLGKSSGVQPASLPHMLRPPEGTAVWGQCSDSHLPERGWQGWFSGVWLWGSMLWPPGELWLWLLSPLPGPGSWHCPCTWSACRAGCCGHQWGPVFNHLSFQTSGTAGPSR